MTQEQELKEEGILRTAEESAIAISEANIRVTVARLKSGTNATVAGLASLVLEVNRAIRASKTNHNLISLLNIGLENEYTSKSDF